MNILQVGKYCFPNQRQIRKQTKSCFWKTSKNDWRATRKKGKKNWRSRRKHFLDKDQKSIASVFSKDYLNEEHLYELKKIVEVENKLSGEYLIHKTGNKVKKIKHMIFKSLKQEDRLEEKLITMIYQ